MRYHSPSAAANPHGELHGARSLARGQGNLINRDQPLSTLSRPSLIGPATPPCLLVSFFTLPLQVHRSQQHTGRRGIYVSGIFVNKRPHHVRYFRHACAIWYTLVEPEGCLSDSANKN